MPAATLEKAINNRQLKGIPMMTVKDIRRHLPPSPATPKGRMKRPRGGIRSTRRQNKDEFEKELEEQLKLEEDMHPTDANATSEGVTTDNNIFCFAALAEKDEKEQYTLMRRARCPCCPWTGTNIMLSHMIMTITSSKQKK